MSLKMKLNLVNKSEYEEDEDYREIIITIPREIEKLERDFKYLGLDYNNLSIQDTHILDCKIIDTDNPAFSTDISRRISNVINVAIDGGWTTTYQDIKKLFTVIKQLSYEDKEKLLAVLEIKEEQIANIKDVIKYGENLRYFDLYSEVDSYSDYARQIIKEGEVIIDDIMDYIDVEKLGKDYCLDHNGRVTDYGIITERVGVDEQMNKQKISEEEFE